MAFLLGHHCERVSVVLSLPIPRKRAIRNKGIQAYKQ